MGLTRLEILDHVLNRSEASSREGIVLSILRDITFGNAKIFEEIFDQYLKERPEAIHLELSRVGFIDSSGVGILVGLGKKMSNQAGILYLLNPSTTVSSILRIVRATAFCTIELAPDEAMEQLEAGALEEGPTSVQNSMIEEEATIGGLGDLLEADEVDVEEEDAVTRLLMTSITDQSITTQILGGIAKITLNADLTHQNAPIVAESILYYRRQGATEIRLDLSGIRFLDSSAIGILIKTANQLNNLGSELVILSPAASIMRIFKIVKIERTIRVIP